MKNVAAYALLVLGGKDKPSAEDVEKLLRDSGVSSDSDKIKLLIEKMAGKPFHEVVAEGMGKLSSMGTGSAPAAGGATAAAEAPKEEAEKEEEEDVDMGGLFGGDDDEY